MKYVFMTLTTAIGLWVASAQAVTSEQFQDAYQHAQAAVAGDKAQIPEAVDKFTRLAQAEPGDPLLLVNLGAVTAMQARTTWLPWKKMRYAEDGMAMQDKALALLTPATDARLQDGVAVTLLVKFTAASTFLAVPRMFGRRDQGAKLMSEVLGSPLFDPAPLTFRGVVWLRAAQLAGDQAKPDQARNYLSAIIEHNAPQAVEAREQLKQIKPRNGS
ncbi:MAG: hypothetical protein LBE78_05495 [Burkholderiaceae bacterium]|jgi:hypothetical protein|nr:hypothetical protein [Burkholderiaceae bacterium]